MENKVSTDIMWQQVMTKVNNNNIINFNKTKQQSTQSEHKSHNALEM